MVSKKQNEELGLGENQNFLDRENHIFLNKLNYICKNYDTAFKDVKHLKRLMDDQVLGQMERQRLTTNETADKVDFLQTKILTIEKHLPTIVQEILEYYFDKKMNELQSNLVDQKTFKEALQTKLDINIFKAYEKQQDLDRKREERGFEIDERLHRLEVTIPKLVTKEENEVELGGRVSLDDFEGLKEQLEKAKQVNLTEQEALSKRLTTLKQEIDEQTNQLTDQILGLETKIDQLDEESEAGESYDDEDDEDLGSEIGDTIDVNDVVNKQGLISHNSSKNDDNDLAEEGEEEKEERNQTESDDMQEESRSKEQKSDEVTAEGQPSQDINQPGATNETQSPSKHMPSIPPPSDFAKTLKPVSRGISVAQQSNKGIEPESASKGRDASPSIAGGRHQTGTDSEISSNYKQSSRKRGLRKRLMQGGDTSSRADTMSMTSGMYGKKKTIKRGGKRSVSMAMQNETLINKIQEQLTEFKKHINGEIVRVDGSIKETNEEIIRQLETFKEKNYKPIVDTLEDRMRQTNKMQESQNLVLKDLHEKRLQMNKRLLELEKTDFDDKFNHITRRMIADVVRECLTPIQMQQNIEIKSIKKLVEEHAVSMEAFHDALRGFRQELDEYRVRNVYESQNGRKEAEGYMKELYRMQKLDHIRVQVSQKMEDKRLSISQNPDFNKTVDFNQQSYLRSNDNDALTQDSLFESQEYMHKASNTWRANQSPANLNTHRSSQFRTVSKEEAHDKESSCNRTFKPSSRNKVVMTRSVDHHHDRVVQASSIFTKNAAKVTAKMHLNHNTTLELVDPSIPKFHTKNSKVSPFVLKEQRRQFVREREAEIQQKILKDYNIQPIYKNGQITDRKDGETPLRQNLNRFESSRPSGDDMESKSDYKFTEGGGQQNNNIASSMEQQSVSRLVPLK